MSLCIGSRGVTGRYLLLWNGKNESGPLVLHGIVQQIFIVWQGINAAIVWVLSLHLCRCAIVSSEK